MSSKVTPTPFQFTHNLNSNFSPDLGGEVYDVLTFPSKNLSFFYESTEKVLYRISSEDRVSALMSSENNDIPSQTLRRDKFEQNLYFFYKEDKFAVLVGVNDTGYENMLQFGGFEAKNVADFRGVGEDKFMILNKNGQVTVFHFSAKFIKKMCTFNLNYANDETLEF
jgi:hypothetical protein